MIKVNEIDMRQSVAQALIDTVSHGLNRGSSGNVSARFADGFLITPSAIPSNAIQAEQIVAMDMPSGWRGELKPSSEWRIHRDIYQARPDAGAVVHVHSPFAVSLACLHQTVPAFHYMVAVAGGKQIPCADYALFGTPALSEAVLQVLRDEYKACLMANHGLITLGRNLEQAMAIAVEVESLCEHYWRVCQMGEPILLSDAQMDDVIQMFKGYSVQNL